MAYDQDGAVIPEGRGEAYRSGLRHLAALGRDKAFPLSATAILLLLVVTLKLFYSNAEVEALRWLLAPTVTLVELFSGTAFLFEPHNGYVGWGGAVVVGAGCAGLNFFTIALCMSFFALLNRLHRHPSLWLVGVVLLVYLVTLWVNALRIVGALLLLKWSAASGVALPAEWHALQGSLFYFIFLVAYYLALQWLLNKRRSV